MSRRSKRARRKEMREQREAVAAAAYRRQRLTRAGGVVIVVALLGLVIGPAVLRDDGGGSPSKPGAGATGSPSPGPEEVACGGAKPPESDARRYDRPEQVLEDGVDYSAVVATSCGDIAIDLLERRAPVTVNSFVFLAEEGYFDGLLWHRVERDFVIQTGDPNNLNGAPPDGPGYTIPDELPDEGSPYVLGTVAMANRGPDTGGSQFFIVTSPSGPLALPNAYSIFGETRPSSYAVMQKLNELPTHGGADPATASMPVTPAYIVSVRIVEE